MIDWANKSLQALPTADVCRVQRTPLEHYPQLAEELGLQALAIKRDDATHPEFGGNKTRKLAFIIGDALRRRARTLVTVGGVGSNHALATSWFGRKASLETVAFLVAQPEHPELNRYARAHRALGTRVIGPRTSWSATVRSLRRLHGAYFVGPGGSSPTGIMGAFLGGLELAEQLGTNPWSAAVVAAGSGGTAAGLAVGLGAAGYQTPVYAVATVPKPWMSARRLRRLVRRQVDFIDRVVGHRPRPAPIRPVFGFVGGGYGHATTPAQRATWLVARAGGPTLDHVYTAKAFAGLCSLARGPLRDERVVFVHTKGAWADSAGQSG